MSDKRSNPRSGRMGIFIGGILLVAAVIAFVSLDGYPPSDSDSVGAIGAAKRYRSEQITESDVQLTDPEMVALLQSDEMQKLIRDDSFQKAVRDQNWAALMENDYFRRIFLNKQFMRVAVDGDLAGRLRQTGYAHLQPEEAYNVFLAQLEDAEINVRGARMSELVLDEEFKNVFLHHQVVRQLVLDEDLIRQRLDADVVSRKLDLDWKNVRPEVDYARLKTIYTETGIAARNPRLPELADDAELKSLFEKHKMVQRIVLDDDLARRWLDVELVSRMRQTELARVRPEEAYNVLLEAARDAEMAAPRVRVQSMATDAEFQKFFEHEMAKTVVLDADFFRPLLETGLASRLRQTAYANLRPEEKYNTFLEAVNEASLSVSKDRLIEVAHDAKFASWFMQSELLQRIVLDDGYARKFYEVALASRGRQTEFITLRPEEAYNTWLEVASDAAMLAPDRRTYDYAVDANFKNLYMNYASARQWVADQELAKLRLDEGLASRLAEVDYINLRPEVSLAQLQSAVAEAQLASPKGKIETLVNDADFMKLFVESGMMRHIVLDAGFARQLREAGLATRLAEFDLVNLRPEVSYNTFLEAAEDASLAERNARVASWAADAQFKDMFQNMKLASTIVLDADMMKLLVEADFSSVAERADTRTVVSDADYLSRYTETP